jgi:hypothetical protein
VSGIGVTSHFSLRDLTITLIEQGVLEAFVKNDH